MVDKVQDAKVIKVYYDDNFGVKSYDMLKKKMKKLEKFFRYYDYSGAKFDNKFIVKTFDNLVDAKRNLKGKLVYEKSPKKGFPK